MATGGISDPTPEPVAALDPVATASSSPRERVWAPIEVLVAVAIVVGANVFDVVPLNETPWLILLGWLSLRRRGLSWRDLGFRRPERWGRTTGLALLAAVALQALGELVTEPLIEHVTGARPDLSEFAFLVGNPGAAIGMIALVWVLAAFGEEMAYRGHVLDRVAALGRSTPRAYWIGMIAVALLFGLGHIYQGPAGVASSTVSGLTFGTLYLASGRNLWLPVLAHGFSDTIGVLAIYFGLVPGLGG